MGHKEQIKMIYKFSISSIYFQVLVMTNMPFVIWVLSHIMISEWPPIESKMI